MENSVSRYPLESEYIQLSSIPFDQVVPFQEWLGVADIFTRRDSMGRVHECVKYDLYDFWCETVKEENLHHEQALF
jgi:hypothetical protein